MNDPEFETKASIESQAPPALGRWGPFQDLQRVGRGSFGEVYRAFDPTLQRHVALKLLLPSRLNQDQELNTLLREARAIARVRHPNVVPVYGVDRHEGRLGFWSDFVQGKTLAELLATHGSMGPREAALVAIDVCRAAGAVHAAGFLHRDIKAGNVMREEGGRILLMDFGLTHAHGTDDESSGTPLYMAPELLHGQPATIASDIYAIGVMLFNLLTLKYPVEGMHVAQLREAHTSATRRTLLDVRPDLPESLARVVETAISPAPEKRFSSTGQMVAALSQAIGLQSQAALEPVGAAPRGRRAWLLAFAALGAAVLLLLLVVKGRLGPSRVPESVPVAGQQQDYRRAHDLLAHYYRPQALETAIPLLERIVAADPQFAPAFADLGRANFLQFAQQRDTHYIEPARESSLRALALAPDLASAHVTLGYLYAFTDQNDLASHELETALRLDKFNAAAYGALAELQTRQGRTDVVEATLQKAVSLAPDDWLLNMPAWRLLPGQRQVDAGGRPVSPCGGPRARQSTRAQQPWTGVPRTGQARRVHRGIPEGARARTDIHPLQKPRYRCWPKMASTRRLPRRCNNRLNCVRIRTARGGFSHPPIRISTSMRRRSGTPISRQSRWRPTS